MKDAISGNADARRLIWPYIFGPVSKIEPDREGPLTINVFKFPDWVGTEPPWERAPAAQPSIEGAPHRVIDAPAQEPG
jgi:hypothetical protein